MNSNINVNEEVPPRNNNSLYFQINCMLIILIWKLSLEFILRDYFLNFISFYEISYSTQNANYIYLNEKYRELHIPLDISI